MLLVAVVLVGALSARSLLGELRARRRDAAVQGVVSLFAPVMGQAEQDPRLLLVWYPIAATLRRLFPEAFRELEKAAGGPFPFTPAQVQAAHARWTAEWLAWERAHDFEYKLKASEAEVELERRGELETSVGRARLERIEREQLQRYQERYEEYIRIAKALNALAPEGK